MMVMIVNMWIACFINMGTLFSLLLQTILHVLSLAISLGAYYAYSFLYGMTCVNCFGLPSTYWVINMCAKSHVYWLVILLTAVVAVLPR